MKYPRLNSSREYMLNNIVIYQVTNNNFSVFLLEKARSHLFDKTLYPKRCYG